MGPNWKFGEKIIDYSPFFLKNFTPSFQIENSMANSTEASESIQFSQNIHFIWIWSSSVCKAQTELCPLLWSEIAVRTVEYGSAKRNESNWNLDAKDKLELCLILRLENTVRTVDYGAAKRNESNWNLDAKSKLKLCPSLWLDISLSCGSAVRNESHPNWDQGEGYKEQTEVMLLQVEKYKFLNL